MCIYVLGALHPIRAERCFYISAKIDFLNNIQLPIHVSVKHVSNNIIFIYFVRNSPLIIFTVNTLTSKLQYHEFRITKDYQHRYRR